LRHIIKTGQCKERRKVLEQNPEVLEQNPEDSKNCKLGKSFTSGKKTPAFLESITLMTQEK
jgi:hypothetical protein